MKKKILFTIKYVPITNENKSNHIVVFYILLCVDIEYSISIKYKSKKRDDKTYFRLSHGEKTKYCSQQFTILFE